MIERFAVTNFKSIKDRLEVDFSPGSGRAKSEHISENGCLRAIAVFGANASGKSNIIKALKFVKKIITDPSYETQYPIYNWDSGSDITEFEIDFTIGTEMDGYSTYSYAVKVRTISDEMADYMSETRHLPRNHYVVMNNWQNDEDFEDLPEKGAEEMRFVFAYVGSINVHANVDLIIKAFHKANLDNAELRIYGGGNRKEQCMALAKELGAENITFGLVSREEVPVIQAKADVTVFALPKGNGGICLPSKMTSYMLSGKPILASIDKGSTAERYINEAQCGFAVEPDNLDALAEAFRKFGKMDKPTLVQMSKNSRRFAEENLTRKANLPKVIEIIESAIN